MNQKRKNNCRKRLKLHILLLLMMVMVYNHNVWAMERFSGSFKHNNGGIYPRGGAMERGFTDVIQIAQLKTRSPKTTSPTIRSTRSTTSNSSANTSMKHNVLTSKRGIISNKLHSFGIIRNHSHDNHNNNNNNNNGKDHHSTHNIIQTDDEEEESLEERLPYVFMRNSPTLNRKSSLASTTTTSDSTIQNPSSSINHGQRLVYRYFGRSRTRTGSDSIPFIILGPSVDHWKICGKILASRGFNVMACERVPNEDSNANSKEPTLYMDQDGRPIHEGEALITSILNALKWQKAVLVGCDEESVLLIEAAIRMAPERVAGLVLCGDLQAVERHVEKQIENLKHQASSSGSGSISSSSSHADEDYNMNVDSFLEDFLDCPTSIIWGGDRGDDCIMREAEVDTLRTVIIGGGVAPHRRLPEQFAWTLSRFVENKVSPHSAAYDLGQTMEDHDGEYDNSLGDDVEHAPPAESRLRRAINYTRYHSVWKDILPENITKAFDDIFAPGSLLVTGRVIAFAIMYMSIARVSLFQYQNIRDLPTTIFSTKNIMNLLASVPSLLFRRKRQEEVNDDGRPLTDSDGNVLFQDEIDENEKLKDPLVVESVPELDETKEEEEEEEPSNNSHSSQPPPDDLDPLHMRDDSSSHDHDPMVEQEEKNDKFHHDHSKDEHTDEHDNTMQDQDLKHFFFDQIVS